MVHGPLFTQEFQSQVSCSYLWRFSLSFYYNYIIKTMHIENESNNFSM